MSFIEGNGDAPVDQVDLAKLSEHDVVRLEISMKKSPVVGKRYRITDVKEDSEMALDGRESAHRAAVVVRLQRARPRFAIDMLTNDCWLVAGVEVEVEDGDDIRMCEQAADPCFTPKADLRTIACSVGADPFDGHAPIEASLESELDNSLATLPEGLAVLEPVFAVENRRGKIVGRIRLGVRRFEPPRYRDTELVARKMAKQCSQLLKTPLASHHFRS